MNWESVIAKIAHDHQEDFDVAKQRVPIRAELQKRARTARPSGHDPFCKQRRGPHKDLNQIATQPTLFDDLATAKCFQPTEKYENLHRFDTGAPDLGRVDAARPQDWTG
ncbi:hypothetical protein DL765_001416 [Monosporascus sp. GIB2]|nr:hypothetical protein DL765_001416 [Monosporascus sp. GIB2]